MQITYSSHGLQGFLIYQLDFSIILSASCLVRQYRAEYMRKSCMRRKKMSNYLKSLFMIMATSLFTLSLISIVMADDSEYHLSVTQRQSAESANYATAQALERQKDPEQPDHSWDFSKDFSHSTNNTPGSIYHYDDNNLSNFTQTNQTENITQNNTQYNHSDYEINITRKRIHNNGKNSSVNNSNDDKYYDITYTNQTGNTTQNNTQHNQKEDEMNSANITKYTDANESEINSTSISIPSTKYYKKDSNGGSNDDNQKTSDASINLISSAPVKETFWRNILHWFGVS